MQHKKISKKALPSLQSTAISKEITPSPSYGSLSGVVQRVQQDPKSVSENERQQLESTIGIRATQEILAGKQTSLVPKFQGISAQLCGDAGQAVAPIQAKLTIGGVGDKYEQEADGIAKYAVQQINTPQINQPPGKERVQMRPGSLRPQQTNTEELQRKKMSQMLQRREGIDREPEQASTDLESSINRAKGSGQPLDTGLQRSIGQAIGADFSSVRVHTDSQSDQLNQLIQAKAFTTGQDVFFRQGAYDPSSLGGQELIAHELTHVVQQNGSDTSKQGLQNKNLKAGISNSQNNIIQRTEEDAVKLANQYLSQQGDYYTPCSTWEHIDKLKDDKFTPEQFEELSKRKEIKKVVNASGKVVPFEPLTSEQAEDLNNRKSLLKNNYANHWEVLSYVEKKVKQSFGATGVNEFYRGAHIVFKDVQGEIYDNIFTMAKGLAAKESGQHIKMPNDVMDKSTAAGSAGSATMEYILNLLTPLADIYGFMEEQLGEDYNLNHEVPSSAKLSEDEIKSGKMYKRRAGTKETSHYGSLEEVEASDKTRPQLGIDFPLEVKGHLLFGVVPNGNGGFNTFVQTEGAGFQNLEEHILEHGKGAIWNNNPITKGMQTGLIGNTYASEKRGTHLKA